MQDQPNDRPSGLVLKCDGYGRTLDPLVGVDEMGWSMCDACRVRDATMLIGQLETKLRMVEAAVRVALDAEEVRAVHPEDLRDRIEDVLEEAERIVHHPAHRADTLEVAYARLRMIRDARLEGEEG